MEVMTFDTKKLLINNLPKESRLGITVFVINKDSSLKVELGSGQIAIFNEKDEMLSGDIKINLWPLFQINPRVNCCDEFLVKSQIIKHKTASTKSYVKEKLKNLKGDKRYRNKERNKYFNNIKSPYKKVLKKATFFSQTSYKTNDKLNYNSYEISSGDNLFINKGDYNKNEFCYIILKFPKFSSPMRYTEKNQFSEEDFKELKDAKSGGKNQLKDLFMFNKFNETINEFKETVPINDEYVANNNPNIESIKENIKNEKDKLSELNIENLFEKLKKINKLISLDPLSPIKDDEDRKDILICRDFLCTDPKALDIFLRAINWFNPLERYLAHLYLNRWAELEPEDALGLLDARFPDTQVRLLAIKTLSKATDDFIDLYMLELCQCLFYENHYISPLSDFLIGRCLKNKKLLGNKFYWCLKVAAENYLFKDKITTLLTQLFMMSGPFFIDNITNIININAEFKNLSKTAKKYYPKEGSEVSKRIRQLVKERFNNGVCKFELPIHPSYCAFGFEFTKLRVFSSKMVPIALNLYSSEGKTFRVIFKIGDDLRQDLMILQIFRIMDKIWMENDLDLKFTLYNVCPIELKCGFMEFAEGSPVEEIQKNMNGGDILQDTLYLYLQNLSYEITQNPNHLQFKKMLDNYIKSLAGYCVATGVLGIADRHPANVMLNFNGLFFHIDFGHIFGNFKTKFGFKRERSVFLLTPQMAYIYIQSNNNKEFINYCTSAYNILRANAKRIINIMITMSSSNMPEFSTMSDLSYVRDHLNLDMNEKEASEYLIKTIKDSLNFLI
jgi:phosphatidylinositol-4,5-bisphosphate 3-kinase